ncbi:toll/interleukin-1 receptor domain-containing protein [Roseateles sp. LYH14W]|uniref:Toll/interleukin-1 receptor domain-containing protein n=1 Tax=Pelomonas parva TaxID=3299032 RepID=A0ABW7F7U9_9BURK
MARVFISYCHADQALRAQLDIHMAMLKRQAIVEVWTDHCIRPGEPFDVHIAAALEEADVILLLVSPDFLHSDYCVTIEMKRALERAAAGLAQAVAVILRPCDWKSSEIGRLKCLPTDGKPVVKFASLDDGFDDVVAQLRTMLTKPATGRPFPKHAAIAADTETARAVSQSVSSSGGARRSSNLNLPRKFSDIDRAEFVAEGLAYIRDYFANSLKELEARNPHVKTRFSQETASFFVASVFSDGKKMVGCGVRQGGFMGGNGISFVLNDDPQLSNSSNESLSLTDDEFNLGWRAMFGGFGGREREVMLTHEGAASHLWDMFVRPLLRQ